MRSPVLFLIFNRPALTRETFACIRQARPPRLYVAADGPREGRDGEAALCEEARKIAVQADWPCEVKTLFRKRNLGCGKAVASAVTWFFQHEPEGIILEDDLAIHPDFFSFCDEMLERYRDVERVMHIHGDNFQYGQPRGEAAYYFSCFPHCWGWASWARAWKKYDHAMTRLQKALRADIPRLFRSEAAVRYFRDTFMRVKSGLINSWAYRWTLSVWAHDGLCVNPSSNMVRNTGFDGEGTHTTNPGSIPAYLHAEGLAEITHPQEISRDVEADEWVAHSTFVHGSTPSVFMQEALHRLEAGAPDGVLGIVRVLRAANGDSARLRQLEALALLQKGLHAEALAATAAWLKLEPSSGEAKKLLQTLKNAAYGDMKQLFSGDTIRIELRSGGIARQGWIGVDLAGADINMDLTKDPLPFPDNSVDYIYSSHVFEHFSYPEPMLSILKECRRCLKDGGIFSICVPDAAIFIDAYMKGEYPEHPTSTGLYQPTVHFNSRIDIINYIAYMNGHHKHMFDIEGLLSILSKSGFKNVGQRTFDPVLDIAARHWQSIYAVATK